MDKPEEKPEGKPDPTMGWPPKPLRLAGAGLKALPGLIRLLASQVVHNKTRATAVLMGVVTAVLIVGHVIERREVRRASMRRMAALRDALDHRIGAMIEAKRSRLDAVKLPFSPVDEDK
ncbi:MAG: hypothetical protein ACYTDY_14015, partial [Planctomycetota bacterium]